MVLCEHSGSFPKCHQPLLGHNMLNDVALMYEKFHEPLPGTNFLRIFCPHSSVLIRNAGESLGCFNHMNDVKARAEFK